MRTSLFFLLYIILFNQLPAQSGELDPTFSGGYLSFNYGSGAENPVDMELLPNGKLMVLTSLSASPTIDFMVARFTKNGGFDSSFNDNGRVEINIEGNDYPSAMELDYQNRILILGRSNGNLFLMRLTPNGDPDNSFANNGVRYLADPMNGFSVAKMEFLPDGKLLFLGVQSIGLERRFVLFRLFANGSLDTSFGDQGITVIPTLINLDRGLDFKLDKQGMIYIGGVFTEATNIIGDHGIAKVLPTGIIDTNFGVDGIALDQTGTVQDRLKAIDLQSDGSIILCLDIAGSLHNDFSAIRISPEGVQDLSFGNNGLVQVHANVFDEPRDIAVFNNDKILMVGEAGGTDKDYILIQLLPDGTLDTDFANNGIKRQDIASLDRETINLLHIGFDQKIYVAGTIPSVFSNPDRWLLLARFQNTCDSLMSIYLDLDNDGFGDITESFTTCSGNVPYGFSSEIGDCNNTDPTIYPGAPELCDGKDNNCNNEIDEGLTVDVYFLDSDLDGFGNEDELVYVCDGIIPINAVEIAGDCDDNNPNINPDADELCNDIDDNCNGYIDDDITFFQYYLDEDFDEYGSDEFIISCEFVVPDGYALLTGDCNDWDEFINPGMIEECNGEDDNCDGYIDEGFTPTTYYLDADGDGFGDPNITFQLCQIDNDLSDIAGDCDDSNPNINPMSLEICNNVDDNCNGLIDDGLIFQTFYLDFDEDGYGDLSNSMYTCDSVVTRYVLDSLDCDDANPNINPGIIEIANNQIDEDCDGSDLITDGIKEINTIGIKVYPNPTNKNVFIEIPELDEPLHSLSLVNALGQESANFILNANQEKIILNLEKQNPGLYLLVFHDAKGLAQYRTSVVLIK